MTSEAVMPGFELVLRTFTVTSALILAGLLILTSRHRRVALPATLLCLAIASFFVTSAPGSRDVFGYTYIALTALCVTKAVWFWLLARALFRERAAISSAHISVLVFTAAVGTWQQLIFVPRFRSGTSVPFETIIGVGFDGVLLALALLGLREAWRGFSTDLIDARRRVRLMFIAGTGAYLLITLGVQISNLIGSRVTPQLLSYANMLMAASACLCAAWLLVRRREATWLDPVASAQSMSLTRREQALLKRLQDSMRVDRLYGDDTLSVAALARHLGTGERQLRKIINQGLGFRNFNDFLHHWRIQDACDSLAQPELADETVLSIAMRAGYRSIGPFNRAFKTRTGMTPSQYRRQRQNGTLLAD